MAAGSSPTRPPLRLHLCSAPDSSTAPFRIPLTTSRSRGRCLSLPSRELGAAASHHSLLSSFPLAVSPFTWSLSFAGSRFICPTDDLPSSLFRGAKLSAASSQSLFNHLPDDWSYAKSFMPQVHPHQVLLSTSSLPQSSQITCQQQGLEFTQWEETLFTANCFSPPKDSILADPLPHKEI